VFSMVTRYSLDGLGFEPRWGQEILPSPYTSRLYLGPVQPTVRWLPVLFPGVERPGCGVDHSNLAPRFVGVQVNLHSVSVPLGRVIRVTLCLCLTNPCPVRVWEGVGSCSSCVLNLAQGEGEW
jgi:hypothetical protein